MLNHRLSLQLHKHRSEQWVIAKGTAVDTCGDKTAEFSEGQNIYIPCKEVHRIENQTDSPVIVIEVQNGDYLGEDDIVRLEDDYSRIV